MSFNNSQKSFVRHCAADAFDHILQLRSIMTEMEESKKKKKTHPLCINNDIQLFGKLLQAILQSTHLRLDSEIRQVISAF